MSHRNNFSRGGGGGRHNTDPTSSSSRFNNHGSNVKYHKRGGGPGNYRPVADRRPGGGDDVDSLTVSINRTFTADGNHPSSSGSIARTVNRTHGPRQIPQSSSRFNQRQENQSEWWRISIPQAGTIGKERVMSTLKTHCIRQFQPYHYFIDRDTNMGVFFVNSQQDADMLKRSNRKIEVQNLGTLNIMVSRASCPVPSLDEDARLHFKDFLCRRRFNQQTFQLNLSNLADDEDLSTLGIYPQLNKQAFVRDVIDIINKELHMTRQLDLGSNNISNLYEFRNLRLDHLDQLSLASNQLRNTDELGHLKHLTHLSHLFIKENPMVAPNSRRPVSNDELISCIVQQASIYHSSTIRQKLPQLKRLDDIELPPTIRFATDLETIHLPKSEPHCVPANMQDFLAKFIDEYYRLFDTRGRGELHACYHDPCMFSMCVVPTEGSVVPTRQYKFGQMIYDSRNLKRIFDDDKRATLLRHGKMAVIDFLRVKFPLTKHDGKSFRVDVISTANNRAVFTVNGVFKEVDQGVNGAVRAFQRTFTCLQTAAGVLIIADHIMILNATDAQVLNMARSSAPPTASTSQTMDSQNNPTTSVDLHTQLVHKFAQESGMNLPYSEICLKDNNWDYDKAAQMFLDLQKKNMIPPEAFNKS